jgi:hypothetical protein
LQKKKYGRTWIMEILKFLFLPNLKPVATIPKGAKGAVIGQTSLARKGIRNFAGVCGD